MSTDLRRDRAQSLGCATSTISAEPIAFDPSKSTRSDNRVGIARTGLPAAFACAWLSACGGGGDSGTPTVPPSLTVTSSTVSVSATTAATAPTSVIKATVSNPGSGQYYFSKTFTTNGLASITAPSAGSVGSFNLQFVVETAGSIKNAVALEASGYDLLDFGLDRLVQENLRRHSGET